jgi:hypothetical protein
MPPDLFRRLHDLGRLEKLVAGLWCAAILAVSVRAAVLPAHSVYPIFSGAARNWVAGADLYRPVGEPYRYSPLVTALFVPFALLPDAVGGVLWRGLSAAAFLGALGWWSAAALPGGLARPRRAWLFLLVLPLAVGNLHNGQSNTLVIALLLAGVTALATRTDGASWLDTLAAAGVALACLFKVYPIALGLLLALVASRRFTARLVLMLAGGMLLPFLLQRPGYVAGQYLGWQHHLETSDRHMLARELWYRDFQELCWTCHVPLSTAAYRAVQLLTAAGCAAACLAAVRAGWVRRRLLALATVLGCGWMTAFGSATESATYVLVAPVAAWAALEAGRPRALPVRGLLAGGYGLLAMAQLANWFPRGKELQMLGVQPFATLLLAAGLAAVLLQDRDAADVRLTTPSRREPLAA